MKKLVFLVALFAAVPAFAIEKDKVSHFAGATLLGLTADTIIYHTREWEQPQRMVVSGGLALIPGFALEVIDEFNGTHFSWYDLLADGLGAATGVVAGELINGKLWISASPRRVSLTGHW
ncbi:hypothetical protein [Geomonas edaphica]|uniref:hypothetical protein n=1 Tax=Geomonas edaphica TaxID=2570226 RepID=UPI0010A89A68|nr:hypothetical protein [Geomonas edaphica]